MTARRLAVHAHFYQPARDDPFTGTVPPEPGATPYRDWTSRITAECYRPNAERGNFGRIGWDLGPTLARWLRRECPNVHEAIVRQENGRNGMAQGYHHSILPLASARDRRTEIRWGLRDFELRFGHRPAGLWLPETAVDLLTLRICAEEGVRYTILAPWQGVPPPGGEIETRRPYRVELGGGRRIAVVLYDGLLSAAVSFEPAATADAERFATERVLPRLSAPMPSGESPLVAIATDGELYGHHQKFRDLFLERLTIPRRPFQLTTVGDVLEGVDIRNLPEIRIQEQTSWSCHHGIARWSAPCPDAPDGRWKGPLRAAIDRLAAAIDAASERKASDLGVDLWAARDGYVDVVSEFVEAGEFIERKRARARGAAASVTRTAETLGALLRAQESRLQMFASDAWFWDDPSRLETAQSLRFAAHAARTIDETLETSLEPAFVDDLRALRSPATGRDGAQLYAAALSVVGQLPGRSRRRRDRR